MAVVKTISLYIMAVLYILAGVNHFLMTDFYLKMMPPFLPYHLELVYISGVIEVALGALLFIKTTRKWAAWGIILLLIAVFPANIFLAQTNGDPIGAEAWAVWVRLPFQIVLIAWAYWYTRDC